MNVLTKPQRDHRYQLAREELKNFMLRAGLELMKRKNKKVEREVRELKIIKQFKQ